MKKGFTLIELLAVIVILAVIALILVPGINKVVDNAKDAANARSVEGHIKDVEYRLLEDSMKGGLQTLPSGTYETLSDFNFTNFPEGDNVKCSNYVVSEGNVLSAESCKDNSWKKSYCYTKGESASACLPVYTATATNGVVLSIKTVSEGKTLTTTLSSTDSDYDIIDVEVFSGDSKLENGYSYDANTQTLVVNNVNNHIQINCILIPKYILGFARDIYKNNHPQTLAHEITSSSNNLSDPDGLYALQNSNGYTYYFRGNVINNYVTFAGLTWRIVRINEDGTVRLILDSNIGTSQFASNLSSPSHVYYDNSIVKGSLNNWYNSTIANNQNYENKIANGRYFCDASNINETANFECVPDANNIGLLDNSQKVGLITNDEVTRAGGFLSSGNTSYYLYKNYEWWISPGEFNGHAHRRVVAGDGSIGGKFVIESHYLRPVINLRSDVICRTESTINPGTNTNPYIID